MLDECEILRSRTVTEKPFRVVRQPSAREVGGEDIGAGVEA